MPNITQYTNQDDQIHPSEIGAEAFAQAGRREGAFFHQIGQDTGNAVTNIGNDYQAHVTQQELMRQNASMANMQANLSDQWNQTINQAASSGKGDDPTVAANFRANVVEPAMQQWQQGFSTKQGQAYGQQRVSELRQHFFEKTAADQSTASGYAAVQQNEDMINGFASAARVDPASSDNIIGGAKANIEAVIASHSTGMGVTWNADQAARFRADMTEKAQTAIASGHYEGLIQNNPQQALAEVNRGRYADYLPEGAAQSVITRANTAIKMQDEAQKAALAAAAKAQKDAMTIKANELTVSMLGSDGSIHPTKQAIDGLRQIATQPGVDSGEVRSMMDMVSAANKAGIEHVYQHSDPAAFANLASRMGIPPGQPNALSKSEIWNAVTRGIEGKGGGLSPEDAKILSDGIDHVASDPGSKAGQAELQRYLTDVKPFIDKSSFTNTDAGGAIQYSRLTTDAYKQYDQMVKSGVAPLDAAHQLTQRGGPNSLEARLASYQTDTKGGMQQLKDMSNGHAQLPPDKTVLSSDQQAWLAAHRK